MTGNPEKAFCPLRCDKELTGFFPLGHLLSLHLIILLHIICSALSYKRLPLTRYDVHLVEELQLLNKVPVIKNT